MPYTGRNPRRMRSKKDFAVKCTICLFLLAGACLLLYPAVSEMGNKWRSRQVEQSYEEAVDGLGGRDIPALFAQADDFNERLANMPDRWALPEGMKQEYYDTLDVSGTGVIGNVLVPKIGVNLPIYHGNGDAVLAVAVGHMEGSSFPVGGGGTHAVISAHTGMASADLFTDLDKLDVGDRFLITVLDRQLVYEVSEINVVLPDEMDYLKIEPGKDKVTLLTCTPHGVNSHRLLVTGVRKIKENPKETIQAAAKTGRRKHIALAAVGAGLMGFGLAGIFLLRKKVTPMGK